jgi:hypothetical protein
MPRINIPVADYEKLGQLIVDSWSTPALRLALINDPIGTMNTRNINVASIVNVRIVVVEDTLTTRHLVLPEDPRVIEGDPDAIRDIEQTPGKVAALGQGATSGCK